MSRIAIILTVLSIGLASPARAQGPSPSPIHIGELVVRLELGGRVVTETQRAFLAGKTPLVGSDLYEHLGRDDLARSYRRRLALKAGLGIGGGLVALGGFALAMTGGAGRTWGGAALAAAGLGAAGVGLFAVRANPVGARELEQLVELHNARLGAPAGIAFKPRASVTVTLTPLVGPRTGGAGVSFNY